MSNTENIFPSYAQHIFPEGANNFVGVASPPWLRACIQAFDNVSTGKKEN